jgi:chemotaxis protein CheD
VTQPGGTTAGPTTVVVGISDCKVTKDSDSVLVTYALGSCIAVTLYDPIAKVGGMLHYMLPESAIDRAKAEQNPFMFADTGIARLLAAVTASGGVPKRMLVRLAGGAQVLDSQGVFQIGKRNCLAARKILWKAGVLITAEAVGGEVSRTIRLEVATGKLWIREGGGVERELAQQHGSQKIAPEKELANGVLCSDRG